MSMWDKRGRDASNEQLFSNRRDFQQTGHKLQREPGLFIHNSDVKSVIGPPFFLAYE